METDKILSADFLDILFDGRNKDYGAYDLRRNYNKRIRAALIGTGISCLLIIVTYVLGGIGGNENKKDWVIHEVQLENIKEEKKVEPIPPRPKVISPKLEIAKFTPPQIVIDDKVKEEEKPPEQEKLQETKIGGINQEGIKDDGITAPPVADGNKGVVEAPKEDYEKLFIKVEIESEYPGGIPAWQRYLHKNFNYPEEAVSNGVEGTVVVRFIVDREGNVSDVEALSGPNELRNEAIRVIRKSGKWMPAMQNGNQVKSYKSQAVLFKLDSQ